MKEKRLALTMLKGGASIAHIAADLYMSNHAIFNLKQGFQTAPCQPEKQEQGQRRRPLMGLMQCGLEM